MQMVRLLGLAGLVGFVLLFAAGGDFRMGMLMAVVLTLLIGLIEPSPAK